MAKRPQTEHGKALAAFIKGQITRDEYKACCRGEAYVSGLRLIEYSHFLDRVWIRCFRTKHRAPDDSS